MEHFLETLGISRESSWDDIRKGYHESLKVWHPDRFLTEPRLKRKAEEKTKAVNYAFQRLEELRGDIEGNGQFEPDLPFIEQYFRKTFGGNGPNGQPKYQDGREGYVQESFGGWSAIGKRIRKEDIDEFKPIGATRKRKRKRDFANKSSTTKEKVTINPWTYSGEKSKKVEKKIDGFVLVGALICIAIISYVHLTEGNNFNQRNTRGRETFTPQSVEPLESYSSEQAIPTSYTD